MNPAIPGDKSISQRALLMAALAEGESRLSGLLPSADPMSTARALRSLGVDIPPLPADGSEIRVVGRGLRGLLPPDHDLDLGNSGTGARLLLGVLAGQHFSATVTGDDSLRSRPMRRITTPLEAMGARFEELENSDRLPIRVHGGSLKALEYDLPVASAQIKSAALFAGLVSGSFVLITEPGSSRDHTERMFTASGAPVLRHARGEGWRVELRDPPERISTLDLTVPGDFSSAAFFLVLGALRGGNAPIVLRNVGVNPTRTGLLPILRRMGAHIDLEDERVDSGGEPTATLVVHPSLLRSTTVSADEVPACVDEIPVLAAAAARAEGVTRITGASELRVKETDRIRALAANLRAVGARVEELEDGLEIEGSDQPLGGTVQAFHDHRIAMAFGVLGAVSGGKVSIDHPEVADVSYPAFWHDLDSV